MQPAQIVRRAGRIGLAGVAIVDHDSIKGGEAGRKIARDFRDFIVVAGEEVNTELGDIVGLFLNSEIKGRLACEVVDEIRAQGGLVAIPHPFKSGKMPEALRKKEFLKKISLIEGINSRASARSNLAAQEFGKEHSVRMIGCSDAHLPFEIGLARTVFGGEQRAMNGEELRKALLKGGYGFRGRESPYLLSHGLSVCIEQLKKIIGRERMQPRDLAASGEWQ